jgi:hypothetical protein
MSVYLSSIFKRKNVAGGTGQRSAEMRNRGIGKTKPIFGENKGLAGN